MEKTTPEAALTAGDSDYHKGLSPRQMQMIAIGGAIGWLRHGPLLNEHAARV